MPEETYDCRQLCTAHGRLITSARNENRCALPGFDTSQWGKPYSGPKMGRLTIVEGDKGGESNEEGCPGAWYRSQYAHSVVEYQRPRDKNGGYSESLKLSRCTDDRVIDAVQYLETERARCSHHLEELRFGR